MDYFQGVVTEYLRANRSTFVNTEYLIQLDAGSTPLKSRFWYCDALAVNFQHSTVYLCEVTYSKTQSALVKRLQAWATNWGLVCAAIAWDSKLMSDWKFQPWAFVPKDGQANFKRKMALILGESPLVGTMPMPLITTLEEVAPWNYCSRDRKHELPEAD